MRNIGINLKMRTRFIIALCLLYMFQLQYSCKQSSHQLTQEDIDSLAKVALRTEYGDSNEVIKKWEGNVLVFLKNPEKKELVKEFEKVCNEINNLSSSISIVRVYDETASNFVIFFSDHKTFGDYAPVTRKYLDDNYGFVWLNWDSNSFVISDGSMYVDIKRTENLDCQRHILREELTQALGLLNDHDGETKSIFYQAWTCFTEYTEMDKRIIKTFLNPRIKANMSLRQLHKAIKNDEAQQ